MAEEEPKAFVYAWCGRQKKPPPMYDTKEFRKVADNVFLYRSHLTVDGLDYTAVGIGSNKTKAMTSAARDMISFMIRRQLVSEQEAPPNCVLPVIQRQTLPCVLKQSGQVQTLPVRPTTIVREDSVSSTTPADLAMMISEQRKSSSSEPSSEWTHTSNSESDEMSVKKSRRVNTIWSTPSDSSEQDAKERELEREVWQRRKNRLLLLADDGEQNKQRFNNKINFDMAKSVLNVFMQKNHIQGEYQYQKNKVPDQPNFRAYLNIRVKRFGKLSTFGKGDTKKEASKWCAHHMIKKLQEMGQDFDEIVKSIEGVE